SDAWSAKRLVTPCSLQYSPGLYYYTPPTVECNRRSGKGARSPQEGFVILEPLPSPDSTGAGERQELLRRQFLDPPAPRRLRLLPPVGEQLPHRRLHLRRVRHRPGPDEAEHRGLDLRRGEKKLLPRPAELLHGRG